MAFTVEAYYEQRTNNDVLDRIEIQQDGGAGRNLELEANSQGFRYRLSEITSESDNGLINPLANKIQVGKLTFFPKIESTAEETLLDDILGSPDNSFRIVWKQDGSVNWTGYIDNKKRSYPETGGLKFTEIRASDFELLKTIDYTLDDTRQTLITTIADLLGNLSFGYNIRTATSWITQDTTDSTDFLSQIYHETKALREFARTGDETDQPISVWDALISVGDPALLFRQVNGEFTVEQLTEFKDPSDVSETVYDSTGTVSVATTSVDRRLTGFTSTDSGNLVVKDGSQNDIYPAIKRAKIVFDHRTQVSGIELPSNIELVDSGTESFTQLFIGDGTQNISLSFDVYAETDIDQASMDARFRILIDIYYLQDDGSWDTAVNNFYEVPLTKGKPLVGGGNVWRGSFSILTDDIPDAADGTMTLVFAGATGDVDFANDTLYTALSFKINNPVAAENSTTIHYQLTQSSGYSTNFTLNNTWFGDGPTGYSVSALRFGTGDGQVTADSWQRRGSVAYRSFHENVLKEIMDLQRSNVRKLNADFWGQYDPSKILVYDGNNYYCAGVSYTGHLGRWSANLFRVNVQTGTDTFEDIPKFTDETGNGSGSASIGGGGGGISQATADDRYLNESENGADIPDVDTFRNNINLGSAQAVTFGSATLSNLTSSRVAYAGASGLLQDSANFTFDGSTLSVLSNDGIIIGAESNAPRLGTQRSSSTGSLTVQPTGSNSPGSVEIFPSGTAVRSHFLATNAPDTDNFGFVEFEVNDTDAWLHAATKGTGATEIDNFRFWNFPQGVKFDDSVLIGSNTTPTAVLNVDHQGDDNTPIIIGDLATPASTTGIYLRSTTSGDIRTGNGADLIFSPNLTEAGRFTSDGDLQIDNDILKDDFSTGATDFSGTGWQGSSAGDFNIRNLIVRESARFRELIIDQLSIIAGSDLLSVARGKIASIDTGANTVTIEDPNNRGATRFVSNDFFWIKSVDIDNSTIIDLKGQISSVSGTTLTLDTTVTGGTHDGGTTDISDLSVGDVIAQRGHPSNTDRQALIYRTVSDSDAPVEKFLDGINSLGSFDTTSNIVVEIGPTSGHFGANNILTYAPDEVGLASFTANDEYLTDGDVYIGELTNASSTGLIWLGTNGNYQTFRMRDDSATSVIQFDVGTNAPFQGARFRSAAGDIVAAFGEDNYLSDLDIDGTLTMGASGEITNSDGGYVIDNDGITMLGPQGSTSPAGFSLEWIGASDGAAVASIWGQLSTPKTGLNIESQNEIRFRLFDTDAIVWESAAASTTSPNTDTGRIQVEVNGSTRYIKLYA